MILNTIRTYGRALMALSFVVLVGYAAIQTIRASSLSATNQEYFEKIENLEQAQELTEALQKANAVLTAELSNLRTQLKGEAGYDTPLPTGIADVLRRVQSGR